VVPALYGAPQAESSASADERMRSMRADFTQFTKSKKSGFFEKSRFFKKNDHFFEKMIIFLKKKGPPPSYLTRENGSGHLKKKGT
jgi:hypothetical protein